MINKACMRVVAALCICGVQGLIWDSVKVRDIQTKVYVIGEIVANLIIPQSRRDCVHADACNALHACLTQSPLSTLHYKA